MQYLKSLSSLALYYYDNVFQYVDLDLYDEQQPSPPSGLPRGQFFANAYDIIPLIPIEIIKCVFLSLGKPADIGNSALVNKQWCQASKDSLKLAFYMHRAIGPEKHKIICLGSEFLALEKKKAYDSLHANYIKEEMRESKIFPNCTIGATEKLIWIVGSNSLNEENLSREKQYFDPPSSESGWYRIILPTDRDLTSCKNLCAKEKIDSFVRESGFNYVCVTDKIAKQVAREDLNTRLKQVDQKSYQLENSCWNVDWFLNKYYSGGVIIEQVLLFVDENSTVRKRMSFNNIFTLMRKCEFPNPVIEK